MQILFFLKYLSVRKWTIAAISIFWLTANSAVTLASPGSNQSQKSKTTTSETTTTTTNTSNTNQSNTNQQPSTTTTTTNTSNTNQSNTNQQPSTTTSETTTTTTSNTNQSNTNQQPSTTTSETTTTTTSNTNQSNTNQTQNSKVKGCLIDNSGVGNNLHDGQYQLSIDMKDGKEPYSIKIDPDNKAQMAKLEDYLFEQGLDESYINSIMVSIQDIEAKTSSDSNTLDICGKKCSLDGDYINTSALDLDSDGIPDEKEGLGDNDKDTIKNLLDSDFDGDGISDYMEAGFDIDQNKDGVSDYQTPLDTDKDGIFDYKDSDSDNDGILDQKEYILNSSDCGIDHDADDDGIYNFRDEDSDNDDIPDSIEAGSNPEEPQDTNNNGIPNFLETSFAD